MKDLRQLIHEQRPSLSTLGERLRFAREARGMTQAALAKAAGLRPGAIGNYEAGMRDQPRALLDIAAALRVTPQWLEKGTGDPEGALQVEESRAQYRVTPLDPLEHLARMLQQVPEDRLRDLADLFGVFVRGRGDAALLPAIRAKLGRV